MDTKDDPGLDLEKPKTLPFMDAMRAKAEVGNIQTADDFYTLVHKVDLKVLINMIDAANSRIAELERQRDDLHIANNGLLQRARNAEAESKTTAGAIAAVRGAQVAPDEIGYLPALCDCWEV